MDDFEIKEPKFLYEWDDKKNRINIQKHGISFEEAATAFEDPNALTLPDEKHSIDEDRFWLIGFSSRANLLIVSHCFREGQVIRIISARKAEKIEKLVYNIRGEI
ncbi:MAG: BrnT family toxin [Anaerolineaceae bacterium]|nr:BrnT family toxin [Anaerolineaceae bacterium]